VETLKTDPMDAPLPSEAGRAAALLNDADSVVVLTGAGMSQESGVPTFRDAQVGLWSEFDPMELATESAFRRNPRRVFGWYVWRFQLLRTSQPNAGHQALARLEGRFPHLTVVTQNVDGFHHQAGSRDIVELHGSLQRFRCIDWGHTYDTTLLADIAVPEDGEVDPPVCAECGSMVRPDVVWFGETLPESAMARAWDVVRACDAMLVVGTSAVVFPAAALPEVAVRRGIPLIEIGPEDTPLTPRVHLSWRTTAATGLPLLERAVSAGGTRP
jgi:NAD-dependent deacetylase